MANDKKIKVFVSYSRHDEENVRPLAHLIGIATEDIVFVDISELKPGDAWKTRIEEAIREASIFVLCWCCASKESEFVMHEISIALQSNDKILVPVLFCSTALPAPLAARQWVDLRGRLIHSCNGHDPTTEDHPQATFVNKDNISGVASAALKFIATHPISSTFGIAALVLLVPIFPGLAVAVGSLVTNSAARGKFKITASVMNYFLGLDKP